VQQQQHELSAGICSKPLGSYAYVAWKFSFRYPGNHDESSKRAHLPACLLFCLCCSWDNVEELSAAAAHKKVAVQNDPVSTDPLEQFCDDNPDADECRCGAAGQRICLQECKPGSTILLLVAVSDAGCSLNFQ
jgi:hypothetical protein